MKRGEGEEKHMKGGGGHEGNGESATSNDGSHIFRRESHTLSHLIYMTKRKSNVLAENVVVGKDE